MNKFGRTKKTSHEMHHNQPTKTILRAGVEPPTYGFLRIPLQSTALPTELSKVVQKENKQRLNISLFFAVEMAIDMLAFTSQASHAQQDIGSINQFLRAFICFQNAVDVLKDSN